jgi:hypothetical protein
MIKRMIKYLVFGLLIALYISGAAILFSEGFTKGGEFLFLAYLFTSFGSVGLLWIFMILDDNYFGGYENNK